MPIRLNYFRLVKYLKTTFLVLVLISGLWAGNTISDLQGWAEDTRIILQWRTDAENQIKGFEIQRSADGINYYQIGFLFAQGQSSSYTYVDDSIMAKVSGRNFHYRLKITNTSGDNEPGNYDITVESNISNVNHTWGSVKALFR
ncbi:MAG: discoidin domain-containing protein [Candidatus Marinimicrobia bacterium]|nr:discoidin domain-containing protein [Candidatus Neomarinimicrobiota bacterium]